MVNVGTIDGGHPYHSALYGYSKNGFLTHYQHMGGEAIIANIMTDMGFNKEFLYNTDEPVVEYKYEDMTKFDPQAVPLPTSYDIYDYTVLHEELDKYSFENNDISVTIDGQKLDFDVKPQIINERTMLPLRAVFEALGADVYWDDSAKTIYANKNEVTFKLTIGDYFMYKNDVSILIDTPAVILNSRTLVPVRFIAQAFDCDVSWDAESKTVLITSKSESNEKENEKQESNDQNIENNESIINESELTNESNNDKYVFQGEGSEEINSINIPEGDYYVSYRHSGNGNFRARLIGNQNNLDCMSIDDDNDCNGRVALKKSYNSVIDGGILKVTADGKWEITFKPVKDNADEVISGSGNMVTNTFKVKNDKATFGLIHKDNGKFCVNIIESHADSYISKSLAECRDKRSFQKTIELASGKYYYLSIEADGDWEIDLSLLNSQNKQNNSAETDSADFSSDNISYDNYSDVDFPTFDSVTDCKMISRENPTSGSRQYKYDCGTQADFDKYIEVAKNVRGFNKSEINNGFIFDKGNISVSAVYNANNKCAVIKLKSPVISNELYYKNSEKDSAPKQDTTKLMSQYDCYGDTCVPKYEAVTGSREVSYYKNTHEYDYNRNSYNKYCNTLLENGFSFVKSSSYGNTTIKYYTCNGYTVAVKSIIDTSSSSNNMELVRNAAGNWSYVFTKDDDSKIVVIVYGG